jgi:hypothetical protein
VNRKNIVITSLISLTSLSLGVFFKLSLGEVPKASVMGATTSELATETSTYDTTPLPTVSSTATPSPTVAPVAKVASTNKKQYGGWYWQPEQEVSLQWLGTDSERNDIWSEEIKGSSVAQANTSSGGNSSASSNSSQQSNGEVGQSAANTPIPTPTTTQTPSPTPSPENNTNEDILVTVTPAPTNSNGATSSVGVQVTATVNGN